MTSTLKVETNVPLEARLLYADKVEGKFGDQIRLKVSQNGQDAYVYLPLPVAWDMKKNGILLEPESGTFKPARQGEITILRTEQGGKKHTAVQWANGGQQAPADTVTKGETDRDYWKAMKKTLQGCWNLAGEVVGFELPPQFEGSDTAYAAHLDAQEKLCVSMFIQATRDGQKVS